MKPDMRCPQCSSENVIFSKDRSLHVCEDCQHEFTLAEPISPLRIFLSYGHDSNQELVRRIKADLEARGHDVWFDQSEIKTGHDWRRSITDGIVYSNRVLSFLSKYSTRDPGVCLDEIAIAIGVKGGNIQTVLVESEQEVKPPPSISHIQWLDMHDWRERRDAGEAAWEKWYQEKFDEIVAVVESDESRRFAGEIKTLEEHLKPISSDSRIGQLLKTPLAGRVWLFEAIEQWRNADRASRLFWIMGAPGVGKSAFAAHLCHYGRDKVIAVEFCDWQQPEHRDARRIVSTLAFQIATRLPDYRKLLLALPEINELDRKNPSELFDYLLADPLRHAIDGGRERYLIVIDALDEAGENGRNELVDMLARNAPRLPDWFGIVVTSRPESDVIGPLQALNPFVLDTATESNRADIRDFLRRELASHLENRPDADRLVKQILEKSEGVFLYIERFCDDVQRGNLSLDRPEQFPQGLGEIFFQYFQRQFPDLEKFRKDVRPALRAILAAREPLPVEILQRLFNWQDEELRDFTRPLGSLFPSTTESGHDLIKPFHKSLADWLADGAKAAAYFVSVVEGHRMLAGFGWQAFVQDGYLRYFIAHLPHHLLVSAEWSKTALLLTDVRFLEAKVATGLTFAIPDDFLEAAKVLPMETSRRRILGLLEEALRRDIHFIAHHAKDYPQALFQCLWNSCWWYDCPEAAQHYELQDGPWNESGEKLFELLQAWRAQKEKTCPGFLWLRCLRPPPMHLGTAQVAVLRGHDNWVYSVAFSPDGRRIVSGSSDKTVRIWDATTGAILAVLHGHRQSVYSVAFSPDGRRVVSGSWDKTARVWDARNAAAPALLLQHEAEVASVDYSPDGRRIVSGSWDKTVRIWDAANGAVLAVLHGHQDRVESVAYSPDGQRIVSGSHDRTVRVWDAESGAALAVLRGHESWVNTVAFSPDGQHIVSGSGRLDEHDNTARLWDGASADL